MIKYEATAFNKFEESANGIAFAGATITVRRTSTGVKIDLFDIDENPIGNPFNADTDGTYIFKIENADTVNIVINEGQLNEKTIRQVDIFDYASVSTGRTFDSFSSMVGSNLGGLSKVSTTGYESDSVGVGAGEYAITDQVGTVGETDGGSYFIDTNGARWELIHNGLVYIEQFGVVDPLVTYSDNLHNAINADRVTKVSSEIESCIFDKVAFINKSNMTVDLSSTLITYVGDYDVYADLGISTDRSIGFINSRGALGTDTATVSSSIVDGTNVLTLDDATDFSVEDYIQLNITYPRRTDEQVAKITAKDGDDITLDYTFAWTVTSCTVTKIDTMRQNNHIKLNLYDNSPATVDANKIAGVGMVYSAMCSASWEVSNHNYPAYINYYCQDVVLSDGYASNPKDITGGRGYNAQTNNSNRVHSERLVSRRCRHNWDSSGSSFCTVKDSHAYSPADNISQYTTHGIYEHDIDFINCYQYDGQNAYSIAQSGVAFGSQNRRVRILGGRCNGVVKSENVKQFTIDGVDFYGTQAVDHEFSGTEGTVIRNVKFNTVGTIRVTVPSDITGPDGIPAITDYTIFDNVDFNDNDVRTTNVKGSIEFLNNCKNFGIMSDSDLVDFPYNIKFEGCEIDIVTGWELRPVNDLKFIDNTIDIAASVSFSAGNIGYITGGELTSSASNARMKLNAPVVTAESVTTKNSVGIFAEANCKNFNLVNISSIEPDASHTSNQFTVEGTTDCTWILDGLNIKYTGSGNSVFFTNATLKAVLTGSYIEGNLQIGTIAQLVHANSNITPDTVLPSTDDNTFSGTVDSTGAAISLPSGWSSSKSATGTYTITHNLGTTAYTVVATPESTRRFADALRDTNTMNFYLYNSTSDSLADTQFGFILKLN